MKKIEAVVKVIEMILSFVLYVISISMLARAFYIDKTLLTVMRSLGGALFLMFGLLLHKLDKMSNT